MRARSMGPLGLGLILLAVLSSVASAKPRVAILGLEVIGSLDPEQVKLAKQLTNGLRERASAGTGPYELAPNSDKELVDEKLMNNCGTEALVCMAPIGLNLRADFLMYGNIEKVDKGYHVTIKLMRVATKLPLPTFSEIIPVTDIKNDPKGVAKRAYAKMTATDEGSVTIRVSNVDRATVYIDDQPMGTTSSGVLTVSVGEGKHRVAVVATEKGWKRHEEELSLNAGDQRNIPVELVRSGGQGGKPENPGDHKPTGDDSLSVGGKHEITGRSSSGGSGAWTGIAIGSSVLTAAAAVGLVVSWYKLYKIGKVDEDTRSNPFAYSCHEMDPRGECLNGELYQGLAWGTAIGATVLGAFTVYAFYRGSGQKERAVASGRSARPRRELTVTPVVSTSGGGATLRLDW